MAGAVKGRDPNPRTVTCNRRNLKEKEVRRKTERKEGGEMKGTPSLALLHLDPGSLLCQSGSLYARFFFSLSSFVFRIPSARRIFSSPRALPVSARHYQGNFITRSWCSHSGQTGPSSPLCGIYSMCPSLATFAATGRRLKIDPLFPLSSLNCSTLSVFLLPQACAKNAHHFRNELFSERVSSDFTFLVEYSNSAAQQGH